MIESKIARLIDVVHKYPEMYYIKNIYSNPNITMDDIETIPEKYWDVDRIILNPNCTKEFVLKYKHLSWSWWEVAYDVGLVKNSVFYNLHDVNEENYDSVIIPEVEFLNSDEIDMTYILKLKEYKDITLEWQIISDSNYKFNITIEDIKNNINLPWDWDVVAMRNDITVEFVRGHLDLFQYSWRNLTINSSISINDILENETLPWDWNVIYERKNYDGIHDVNIEYISKNLQKGWNWDELSITTNVSMIDLYPNLPWNWEYVAENKTLNINFVLKHLRQPTFYMTRIFNILPIDDILKYRSRLDPNNEIYDVSKNPTLTLKTLIEYYGEDLKEITMYNISVNIATNDNFSIADLEYILSKKKISKINIYEKYYFSNSPNITPKYILEHTEMKWSDYETLYNLAQNKLNYEKRKKWTNHLEKIYLQKVKRKTGKYMKNENLLGANVLADIVLEYK
jgi:hypothetical protein